VPRFTPTPEKTPTPPPDPKEGSYRGYLVCTDDQGQVVGPGHGVLWVQTNDPRKGYTLVGGVPDKDGYVFTKWTMLDTGTTVLAAGPGECVRGGDNYPADQTEYSLEEQPIFGAGNVGNGAVVCKVPCTDTSTFVLPRSGAGTAEWFVGLVLDLIYWMK